MAQRTDPVHEPGDYLSLAVRALVGLQRRIPADTPAAHRVRVVLAGLGHLEVDLRRERLIPPPARGEEGRHIL